MNQEKGTTLRFNVAQRSPVATGTTSTATLPDTQTYEGARGYTRDAKSELFLVAASTFLEGSFYESYGETMVRITNLATKVAVEDPQWFKGLVFWLRHDAGLRSVSVLLAVTGAHALLNAKIPGARQLISAAIARADEPGEILAAWRQQYGRSIPIAVKRGINDTLDQVWTEYSVGKYSGSKTGYSLADVLNVTHPSMRNGALAEWIMEHAYGRDFQSDALPQLKARADFLKMGPDAQRRYVLSGQASSAGLTWELVASTLGKPDAAVWEALLPAMGYMAKLRALRRLGEAGLSYAAIRDLAYELSNPENVRRSKQLPLRFLAAHKQAPYEFASALEIAVNFSLGNVPSLTGRTLVLVDRSGSMTWSKLSQNSSLDRSEGAALFGSAVALRAENADLFGFGTYAEAIPFRRGDSLLQVAQTRLGVDGGGTDILGSMQATYRKHDRVVLITDEQTGDFGRFSSLRTGLTSLEQVVPLDVPVHIFNVGGYAPAFASSAPNRYTFGGLSDHCFAMIPWIEDGQNQKYPWEKND